MVIRLAEGRHAMNLFRGAILLILSFEAVTAQPASVSSQQTQLAHQLLSSSRWTEKAWGSYLAGQLRSEELDEQLIEQFRVASLLRDWPAYTEEHAFVNVLLDAAIESGIMVPSPLLEPFEEKWTDAVIILLARAGDSEQSLLRIRSQSSRDIVWLAVNNLLLANKSQRWYEAILEELRITHRFTVTDSADGLGSGGGAGGGSWGDGVAAMPKGFPPVRLYSLSDFAARGSVLLAQGPRDVYYKTTMVPTDKQVGFGSGGSLIDRMALIIGYLARLGSTPEKETVRLFHAETPIRFTTMEDFEREVDQSMKAQEQGIRSFIQAIEKSGLAAPSVTLRIVPEVNDNRKSLSSTLPAVAPRDIDLP